MTRRLTARRPTDERGSFMVLWAVLVTSLLVMVAMVIDLGAGRNDRRIDREAADAAATAGAMELGGGQVDRACAVAWSYVMTNLKQPVSTPSPCPTTPTSCYADSSPPSLDVTGRVNSYVITIRAPIKNTDTLFLNGESMGGDVAQPVVPAVDGSSATAPCERLGVRIQYTRQTQFARLANASTLFTDVHSVARYTRIIGGTVDGPALIALAATKCPAVDANNGVIHVYNNDPKAARIIANSSGSDATCASSSVYNVKNSGYLIVDPGSTGTHGQIQALTSAALPDAKAWNNTGSWTGDKVRGDAWTRTKIDTVFHCHAPGVADCSGARVGTDPIENVQTRYGAANSAPAGFSTFPGGGLTGDCSNPPTVFPTGNWYVNCPSFLVKNKTIGFQSGDVIFAGNINFDSNGYLNFNTMSLSSPATATDNVVVVQGTTGITTSSNTWGGNWSRTAVIMTNAACQAGTYSACGTWTVSNGNLAWTAPAMGAFRDLLYWSETTNTHGFQGNPTFTWDGIFFAGRSLFDNQGNAVIDARNVQLWVDSVALHNSSAQILLRPDPDRSIGDSHAGAKLIR